MSRHGCKFRQFSPPALPCDIVVREAPRLHPWMWDSCFSLEHAHIHGKNFRPRIHDRYRQWLTYKLASWIDQFGTSGSVGCGRCITWCPVGIDLTEEVAAIPAERDRRRSA